MTETFPEALDAKAIALPFGDDSILTPKEVARILRLNIRTLDRHVAKGLVPKKLKIGPHRTGFRAGDIRDYIRNGASSQPATAAQG